MATLASLTLEIDARRAKQGADEFKQAGESISKSAQRASEQVDRTGTELDRLEKSSKTASDGVGRARDSLGRFTGAAKEASGQVGRTRDALGRFKRSADDAGDGARNAADGVERMGRRSKAAQRNISDANRGLRQMAAQFALIATAHSAIRTIASFEQSMATLKAVTNASNEDLQALSETAQRLGESTKFSATEAGDALVFLARAGLSASDAMAAVPATLDLAAAGALGLGEAADIASNVLSQFRLLPSQMQRVADVMVTTANNSNTNIQQLGEAMNYAGSIAGTTGQSLEQTAASIGILGNAGIQASMAGTNVRGMLASLLSPSERATAALADLGISLSEVNPTANSMTEIFELLGSRGITAAQAIEIFNNRNAGSALVLANNNEELSRLVQLNHENDEAARRAAATMSDTLTGAFERFQSAVASVAIATGEKGLRGNLKNLVDTAASAIKILFGTADAMTRADESAQRLALAFKAIAIVLAAIALTKFISLIVAASVKIVIMIGHIGLLIKELILLKATAAAAMSNPLIAGAAFLTAGVIGAIALFSSKNDEATESVNRHRGAIISMSDSITKYEEALKSVSAATTPGSRAEEMKAAADLIQQEVARIEAAVKAQGDKRVAVNAAEVLRHTKLTRETLGDDSIKDPLYIPAFAGATAKQSFFKGGHALEIYTALHESMSSAIDKTLNDNKRTENFERAVANAEKVRNEIEALVKTSRSLQDNTRLIGLSDADREREQLAIRIENATKDVVQSLPNRADSSISGVISMQLERMRAFAKFAEARETATKALEDKIAKQKQFDDDRRTEALRSFNNELEREIQLLETSSARNQQVEELRRRAQEVAGRPLTRDEISDLDDKANRLNGLQDEEALTLRRNDYLESLGKETELLERATKLNGDLAEARRQARLESLFQGDDLKAARELYDNHSRAAKALKDLNDANAQRKSNLDGDKRRADQLLKRLNDLIAKERQDVTALQAGGSLPAEVLARQKADAMLSQISDKQIERLNREGTNVHELADDYVRLAAERERVSTASDLNDLVESHKADLEFARLPSSHRQIAEVELEFDAILAQLSDEQIQRFEAQGFSVDDLRKKLIETARAKASLDAGDTTIDNILIETFSESNLRAIGDRIGDTIGQGIEDLITSAESLNDVFENVFRSLSQIAVQEFFTAPLKGIIGDLAGDGFTEIFSAQGNAFHQGHVLPFAKGGVISSPISFPLAGRNVGIAGEAGPEAILPLKRGAGGSLGVEVTGGSREQRPVVIHMHISTPDASSFRKSARQITADLRRGLG